MNWILFLISLLMLTADCDNFMIWLLWELAWFTIMVISAKGGKYAVFNKDNN